MEDDIKRAKKIYGIEIYEKHREEYKRLVNFLIENQEYRNELLK